MSTKKVSYQRDTQISASIPEWLNDRVLRAAGAAGCSRSEMVADLLCLGLTEKNLMEHEGEYRRALLLLEVAEVTQNKGSFGDDK
jgi:metal-responsive CopG/Arc/MetJ family transcriptional regulator